MLPSLPRRKAPFILVPLAVLVGVACLSPLPAQQGSSNMGRSVAKSAAARDVLPDPEAVRVEDFVNEPRHRIPLPKAGQPVALDLSWDSPFPAWQGRSVLQIGIATSQVHDRKNLPPLNLALVIDTSGSMAAADKMSRVKEGLFRFLKQLRAEDRIAIIGYATEASVLLPSQPVGDGYKVGCVIGNLSPSGNTNLHDGLMLGYKQVSRFLENRCNHRVILLTDGIANAGVTDPLEIARNSRSYNARGIDLSTIGVGSDFNQELLRTLAKSGRGLCHFVADEKDIRKVFVNEAQALVGVVARKARLRLRHGPGIEILKVYGYRPERHENGFSIQLEDFNYGMTQVVLVSFRRRNDLDSGGDGVAVELTCTPARTGVPLDLGERTRFLSPGPDRNDFEVRKNFTIAVLAQATRRLASLAQRQDYAGADRAARQALAFFRKHYPNTQDKDLLENRNILRRYQQIVGQHVERFRDQ